MCTTRESELETQPLLNSAENLTLTFDGRIDNRKELIAELPTPTSDGITDAALVLKAYERWGPECVARIVGDFAFILWDAHEARIFCARDALGVRPLFYVLTNEFFAAASGVPELLACPGVTKRINEGMVGEYLSADLRSHSETLYGDVLRLPPGHSMFVDANRTSTQRYWQPENIGELNLSGDELAECFLALFKKSVLARTRSNLPLAADLSGGLDSSSIVSVLGQLQQDGSLQQSFECFSWSFPGLTCDETPYAASVIERWGCKWNRLKLHPMPPTNFEHLARRDQDFPGYPNRTPEVALEQVRGRSMRVSLSGTGGDEWLGGASTFARCFDLLLKRRMGLLAREATHLSSSDLATLPQRFGGQAARALNWSGPRRWTRSRRLPSWLDSGFVDRAGLIDRGITEPHRPEGWSLSRHLRLLRGTSAAGLLAMELEERSASRLGVEFRYPFLDRRLVEFMIAVPEQHLREGALRKVLLRTAVRGLVPELVRLRSDKAEFSHMFREALMHENAVDVFSRRESSCPDWVHWGKVQLEAARYFRGESGPRAHWPLWSVVAIDTWHRFVVT